MCYRVGYTDVGCYSKPTRGQAQIVSVSDDAHEDLGHPRRLITDRGMLEYGVEW